MFTVSGFNSGLDVNAMVSSLVQAERAPKESQITRSRNAYNVELTALGSIQGAIDTFQSAVAKLNSTDSFQARTTTLSDADAMTVIAGSASVKGTYQLQVNALASSHSIVTDTFQDADTFGAGSLQVNLGSESFNITLDSSNNTLTGIKDAINSASDNPGVQATIINDGSGKRLLLTSNKSGAANSVSVDSSALTLGGSDKALTTGISELSPARDAEIVLGEGAGQIIIKSADNSFENLIDGVTIDVKKVTSGSVTLQIAENPSVAEDAIKEFVDAYNALINKVNELSLYQPGQDAAALVGDATVRSLQSQLRRIISDNPGTGDIKMLADLGIKTQSDGTLSISSSQLSDTVNNNFSELSSFFSGGSGIAGKLENLLDAYNKSDGIFKDRMDTLNKNLTKLDDERSALNARMETFEQFLRNRFLAMETLVGQLNATSQYLTNNLAGLNNNNN
ncbi:MAG: flagellar filament capping protein FliD [Endozoicomonas sp.]|uniref:flagellar filament capping protein FliD n=1 Tax=Endozoicomonas sp. TaxID=1892382 RepID=UPI003D9AC0E4